MNECAFCEQGVRPFYDLNTADGSKQPICHTCFHLGKHKVQREALPSTTKSQPVGSPSSTATKK